MEFEGLGGRKVVADFAGGAITSDAGVVLLRETDRAIGLSRQVAGCFDDRRDQDGVVHKIETLIAQRIHGIALGYEDLVDHDDLRHDPAMALLSETLTPKRADCAVLAGKSTLNRLECSASARTANARYHKFGVDETAMARVFVTLFLNAHDDPPKEIILDLDATDDPLHGHQEGRFFHGYYDCYCYLPLYIFCGRHLLAAKLRPANKDGAHGSCEEVARIIAQIRDRWPDVGIVLRADSGFCRDDLMAWCEANRVDYVFGLAKNSRLVEQIGPALAEARRRSDVSARAERIFTEFSYRTQKSWSRARRVVAKAEFLSARDGGEGRANPRFIVTSLARREAERAALYEETYCARGEMENRIKECQLDLLADRTSAASMAANQLRLWFAALAYVLIDTTRRVGLVTTKLAKATAGTIRTKLLKIGALVTVSVRRIKIACASGCPYRRIFAEAHARLHELARRGPRPAAA